MHEVILIANLNNKKVLEIKQKCVSKVKKQNQ